MRIILGTCGKAERYVVYWLVGDAVIIPAVNVMFSLDRREKEEALAVCRRNLLNFVEA